MIKHIVLSTALLVSFSCISQEANEEIEELLSQFVSEQIVVGISAGYTVDNEIKWQSSAGYLDRENGKDFELGTIVRIASISKPMTALAVMQLVEKDLIDLDAPIQTYIPDYPKQERTQITARHLLSHTSGIDGYKNAKEAETTMNYPSLSDAVNVFKNRDLIFEPGTRYSYTTYGYTVLGLLIEKVSGITFEEYMQNNIWNRAEMTDTGVVKFGVAMDNKSAFYHRTKKGKIKEGNENNLSNRIPGGGFYSTLGDMLKFGNAVLNNVFVKESTLNLMREHHSLEKERNAYGFGWFLYNPKPNEGVLIGHTGEQTGSSAQIFIVPSTKTVTVALANTSGSLREISTIAGKLITISQKDEK